MRLRYLTAKSVGCKIVSRSFYYFYQTYYNQKRIKNLYNMTTPNNTPVNPAGQPVKAFTKEEMYDKVKVVAPVVPRAVEEALIEKLREHSRVKCKDKVAAYAECTKDKTFSVAWACRDQLNNMNECLKLYTSSEQLDRLKVAWTKQQEQKKETNKQ